MFFLSDRQYSSYISQASLFTRRKFGDILFGAASARIVREDSPEFLFRAFADASDVHNIATSSSSFDNVKLGPHLQENRCAFKAIPASTPLTNTECSLRCNQHLCRKLSPATQDLERFSNKPGVLGSKVPDPNVRMVATYAIITRGAQQHQGTTK